MPLISKQLTFWHEEKVINWIVLESPSVVAAMNVGLINSSSEYVMFLDDDIKPFDDLVEQYQSRIERHPSDLIAGRVIQPWDNPSGVKLAPNDKFLFNSMDDCQINLFMGGNFLVNRELALALGGFDENFKGTAHNFEREFADRLIGSGHEIHYCAAASIYHLKEESGGIRSYGHFLKTIKPHHAVGAYYYILRSKLVDKKLSRILKRLYERVATKTHLREPWWIPLTLIGDLLGILWAFSMWLAGPKLIENHHSGQLEQLK